jgi:hypothetical protein
MKIVTLPRLNSALSDVIDDFIDLGFWNERIQQVDVYLVPVGFAYGWKYDGAGGHIHIPAVSMIRVAWKVFGIGGHYGLRDLLRHEYAHAVADLYPRLSHSRSFLRAFGGSYDRGRPVWEYHPHVHVSAYAATQPAEDFAENFAAYVKHKGKLPTWFDYPDIRERWRFIRAMLGAIKKAG